LWCFGQDNANILAEKQKVISSASPPACFGIWRFPGMLLTLHHLAVAGTQGNSPLCPSGKFTPIAIQTAILAEA